MTEEILLLIGERIRGKRQEKKLTTDQLASKAGVTKGLISQIENNRTLPSLPVLINIIHALDMELKSFFESIQVGNGSRKYLVMRPIDTTKIDKEPVKGFLYKRIMAKTITGTAFDLVTLEIKPGFGRKALITTEAYELKYVLQGQVEYQIEDESFLLRSGDTLAFDGRLPHRIKNVGKSNAILLILYLF